MTKPYKTDSEKLLDEYDYYNPVYKFQKQNDGDGEEYKILIGIKFDHLKIVERLQDAGFCAYPLGDTIHLLRILDRQAETTDPERIALHVSRHIRRMPKEMPDTVTRRMVLAEFLKNEEKYFKKSLYKHLAADTQIEFHEDTADRAYFFYANCIAEVSRQGIKQIPYSNQTKTVWKSQVHTREFHPVRESDYLKCNWAKFCENISGHDAAGKLLKDRFLALQSIIGYSLHKYFDRKLKAIAITDGRLSDTADGRSGKTLFVRGLGYMLNANFLHDKVFVEIPGKNFDQSKSTKYEKCDLETRLIHLNDIVTRGKQSFDIELLFNDISDGTTIRHLYKPSFSILTKFIISANRPLRVEGGSAKDRIVEMELADHYSIDRTPEQEFKQWFFTEWTDQEWAAFDNFMLHCVQVYFQHGLLTPPPIMLQEIKLVNETSQEFLEYIGDINPVPGLKYLKLQLYEGFVSRYKDYERWLTQRKFNSWLRKYCDYTPGLLSYENYKGADKKQRFEPRNLTADVDLNDKEGIMLPIGDCFVFPPDHQTQ